MIDNNLNKTREPQYQQSVTLQEQNRIARFGIMSNRTWQEDPKRLLFVLSRYKFVSKMFSGYSKVLEIGCADGFASRIVAQEVKHLVGIDFDPIFIENANHIMEDNWKFDCYVHDIVEKPVGFSTFDGVYALDVIEHIHKNQEQKFLKNIVDSLNSRGVLIIGTPSLESQQYASQGSKEGHINFKDQKELKPLLNNYFNNVFIFSMNDEIIHTGFYPLAHYLFAICCNKKSFIMDGDPV